MQCKLFALNNLHTTVNYFLSRAPSPANFTNMGSADFANYPALQEWLGGTQSNDNSLHSPQSHSSYSPNSVESNNQ